MNLDGLYVFGKGYGALGNVWRPIGIPTIISSIKGSMAGSTSAVLLASFADSLQRLESARVELHEAANENDRVIASRNEIAASLVRFSLLFYKTHDDVTSVNRLRRLYQWRGFVRGFTRTPFCPPMAIERLKLLRRFTRRDFAVYESEDACKRCRAEVDDAEKELNAIAKELLKEEKITVCSVEEMHSTVNFYSMFVWSGEVTIRDNIDSEVLQAIHAIAAYNGLDLRN